MFISSNSDKSKLNMKNFNLSCLLILLALPFVGFAQNEKPAEWCGSEYPANMLSILERVSAEVANGTYSPRNNYTMPLTIHVLRNSDGSGGVSDASVYEVFCETSEKYAEYGMNLYLNSIEYHDNSTFNSNPNSDGTLDLLYSVASTVNIFVHSAVSGQDLCGVYKGSAIYQQTVGSPDLIQVSSVCWSGSTLIHELGHYFGLPHTFFGHEGSGLNCNTQMNNAEKVDGSNCTTKGDRICDTPPDYSSDRWQCNPQGEGCNQIDPDGVQFRPDGTNYMSYSNDACVSKFTANQVDVMKALIDNLRQDLYNLPVPAQMGDITGTSSAYLPPDGALRAYDEVYFNWTPVGNATSYIFEINRTPAFSPTFTVEEVTATVNEHFSYVLQPNQTYYWRVKPLNPGYTCAPYSETADFMTADWTVANEDIEGLEGFNVSPNPVLNGQSVNIELQSSRAMEGTLNLYNVQGQRVYSENVNLAASLNRFAINTQNLPAGMYVVSIDFAEGAIQKKLIIGQ